MARREYRSRFQRKHLTIFLLIFVLTTLLLLSCPTGDPTRIVEILCEPMGGEVQIAFQTHSLPWSGEVKKGDATIEAIAPGGWEFQQWSGDVPGGSSGSNPLELDVQDASTLTVHWLVDHEVTAHVDDVSPNPQNQRRDVRLQCHGSCKNAHAITAFQWRSDVDGAYTVFGDQDDFEYDAFPSGQFDIYCRVQCADGVWSPWSRWVDGPLVILLPVQHTLSIASDPGGGEVEISHIEHDLPWSKEYSEGDVLSLQAVAPVGCSFVDWTGDISGGQSADNPLTITIAADTNITAHWSCLHTVTASVDEVSPNPQTFGNAVSFVGSGSCSQGHAISAYEWESDLDGGFGIEADFVYYDLSIGSHTIFLRVQCANGVWSDWTEWSGNPLIINSP
jgi:hypothetical protein